jgi:hypothetical protein
MQAKRSCPLEEGLTTSFLEDATLTLSFPLAKLLLGIVVTIFKNHNNIWGHSSFGDGNIIE